MKHFLTGVFFSHLLKSDLEIQLFALILVHSNQRELILSLVEDMLRETEDLLFHVLGYAVTEKEGNALFCLLKKKNLLDFELYSISINGGAVNHVEALKWMESNGVDIMDMWLTNASNVECCEYLISERDVSLDDWLEDRISPLHGDMIEMMLRTKGKKEVEAIDPWHILCDFENLKLYRSMGLFTEEHLKLYNKESAVEVFFFFFVW